MASKKAFADDFDGMWFNELGSCMKLNSKGANQFTGNYLSPAAEGKEPGKGKVVGQYKGGDDTFSFSVTWDNYKATTGWAGEYKMNKGQPVLYTTWLLVKETKSIGDLWMNTQVGQDKFTRYPQVDNNCAEKLLKIIGRGMERE